MTRHLLQVVWNRKRASGLLIAELSFSFLVLCAVALMGVDAIDSYRQPIGFDYRDVWLVFAEGDGAAGDPLQVRQALLDLEEVEAVGRVDGCAVPFGTSWCYDGSKHDGRSVNTYNGRVSDEVRQILGLEVAEGRWFERADDALAWQPAVINQRLRRELFGPESPLDRNIGQPGQDLRVVGVVTDYRKGGELGPAESFRFERLRSDEGSGTFLVRVRPGTTERFEEKLLEHLQARAKGWSFLSTPLVRARQEAIRLRLTAAAVAVVIAAFLLLMVALGLVGVLWQSVTQRTRELGLRRAVGATAGAVRRQVLAELLVLTSLGVVLGTAVALQVPLFEVFGPLTARVYAGALAAALLVMYSLVLLCGLYPSWLATRVPPAQALHHE